MIAVVEKKQFNTRGFVSLVLLVAGVLLPPSGLMNHQLQFDLLTPARHFWMSVHNVSALLFTTAAIVHIVLNRKSVVRHATRLASALLSKEAIAALSLVAGVVGLFALHAFHAQ